jgi:hypothetical protein
MKKRIVANSFVPMMMGRVQAIAGYPQFQISPMGV